MFQKSENQILVFFNASFDSSLPNSYLLHTSPLFRAFSHVRVLNVEKALPHSPSFAPTLSPPNLPLPLSFSLPHLPPLLPLSFILCCHHYQYHHYRTPTHLPH